MLRDVNYRFNIKASLKILNEQRKKLYNDSINGNTDIYMGLYSKSSSAQKLYFQKYFIVWLINHWNEIQNLMAAHDEYTINERRYFLSEFSICMMNMYEEFFSLKSETEIFSLMCYKDCLEELQKANEKWESYLNKCMVELKKNEKILDDEIERISKNPSYMEE